MAEHTDAIQILKSEIGRLRFCANAPTWAALRRRSLARCENAARTVRFLEGVDG